MNIIFNITVIITFISGIISMGIALVANKVLHPRLYKLSNKFFNIMLLGLFIILLITIIETMP